MFKILRPILKSSVTHLEYLQNSVWKGFSQSTIILKLDPRHLKNIFKFFKSYFISAYFQPFYILYHHSSNLELFTHWPPNQLQKQQNPVTNDLYTFLKHYFKHSPFCIAKCCFPKMVKPLSLIQKNPCWATEELGREKYLIKEDLFLIMYGETMPWCISSIN